MPDSKYLPPRTRGQMVDDLTSWMAQRDIVVIPRDLADDLFRCASAGQEANPDWREESISIGRRCLELRQQRDESCASLVAERAAHEKTKAKCADLAKQIRQLVADHEDKGATDGRSNVSDQRPRIRAGDSQPVPGTGLPG